MFRQSGAMKSRHPRGAMISQRSNVRQTNPLKKSATDRINRMMNLVNGSKNVNPADGHQTKIKELKSKSVDKRFRLDTARFLDLFDDGDWNRFNSELDNSFRLILNKPAKNTSTNLPKDKIRKNLFETAEEDPYEWISDSASGPINNTVSSCVFKNCGTPEASKKRDTNEPWIMDDNATPSPMKMKVSGETNTPSPVKITFFGQTNTPSPIKNTVSSRKMSFEIFSSENSVVSNSNSKPIAFVSPMKLDGLDSITENHSHNIITETATENLTDGVGNPTSMYVVNLTESMSSLISNSAEDLASESGENLTDNMGNFTENSVENLLEKSIDISDNDFGSDSDYVPSDTESNAEVLKTFICRKKLAVKPSDKLSDELSDKSSDKPPNNSSDKSSDKSSNNPANKSCDELSKRSRDKPAKTLSHRTKKTQKGKGRPISADIILPTVTLPKPGKKRAYDKLHHCLFCGIKIHKISRHIQVVHRFEEEVKNIPPYDKNDPNKNEIRNNLLEILVNEGDFYYNREVLATKQGMLILKRSPSELDVKRYTYVDYTPCPHCLAIILKRSLTDHSKNCIGTTAEAKERRRAGLAEDFMSKSQALLGSVIPFQLGSNFYTDVVIDMKDDDIKAVCTDDSLILQVGAFLFEKFGTTQLEYIRQSMRMLGRLLLEAQIIDKNFTSLTSLFDPSVFDSLVLAVKNLCIYKLRKYDRPEVAKASLLLKLGPLIKKAASLRRGICLRNCHNKDLSEEEKAQYRRGNRCVKDFLSVMDLEWRIRLSSSALVCLKDRQYKPGQLLPITSDLIKVDEHTTTTIETAIIEMDQQPNVNTYRLLSEHALTNAMLFNKKRTADISNMKVQDWTDRPSWEDSSEEIKNSLSSLEIKLAERMAVCDVIGKHHQHVPVIVTPLIQKAFECMLRHCKAMGIDPENPFLFAISGYKRAHLRAHVVLGNICKELPLQAPQLIKGTYLRKYIATVTQVLNLTENEQDWLARHLGHDIRVHRQYYRLHEHAVEATKISRLLLAVKSGSVVKFAGKKLSEIALDDLPPLDAEKSLIGEKLLAMANDGEDVFEVPVTGKAPAATQKGKSAAEQEEPATEKLKPATEKEETATKKVKPATEKESSVTLNVAPASENGPVTEEVELQEVEVLQKEPKSTRSRATKFIQTQKRKQSSNVATRGKKSKKNDYESYCEESGSEDEPEAFSDEENRPIKGSKGKQIHVPWTDFEKEAVRIYFKDKLQDLSPIGYAEAQQCINANKISLRKRDKKSVKTWYFNYRKKLLKLAAQRGAT